MKKLFAVMALCIAMCLPVVTVGRVSAASAPKVTKAKGVVEYRWSKDAGLLLDVAGNASPWRPVSARFIDHEGESFAFIEVYNTSGEALLTPTLHVELFSEGASYGDETFLGSERSWTPSHHSSFFQTASLYGGSIASTDWDELVLTVEDTYYQDSAIQDTSRVQIKQNRLFNVGDTPVGKVYTSIIRTDQDGVFTASCMGPFTGAITQPGKSVRFSAPMASSYHPICGFSVAGEHASETLKIGGPYKAAYVINQIDG